MVSGLFDECKYIDFSKDMFLTMQSCFEWRNNGIFFFTNSWIRFCAASLSEAVYRYIIHKNLLHRYLGSYQSKSNVQHNCSGIIPGVLIIEACQQYVQQYVP